MARNTTEGYTDHTDVQLDKCSQTGHICMTGTQIKKGCAQPPRPPGAPHGRQPPA